uniref:Putative reverse transcriptase domain-containing protein n=1 Tax=Tanacetum cinerariifolium TaxID=118510 RepID=A0A6L2L5B9_TANCI|nr:putative reverse transcriptase domain-containing protein [Tanacetum cinerariifolium]
MVINSPCLTNKKELASPGKTSTGKDFSNSLIDCSFPKTTNVKYVEEVTEEAKSTDEIPEEKIKEMMQLIPIEEVYVEALQVKHPIIDWKVHKEGQRSYWKIIRVGGSSACYQFFVDLLKHLDREDLNQLWILVKEYLSIRPASSDKEMELWVELKRLYEPDPEDQLKVLALVMICYKLQVENFSQMENDLVLKIYKIANSPRQQGRIVGNKIHKAFPLLVRKFPLPEGTSHFLKKNATARRKVMPLPQDYTAMMVSTLRIKLYSEYEYEIRYHPSKENVVTDALSRKERVKPRRVRAMAMTIQYGVRGMILAAQSEAFKKENILAERLHGLDQQMERKEDKSLYFMDHAAKSVRDAIRFEYCLASSSRWTKPFGVDFNGGSKNPQELLLGASIQACVDNVWKLLEHQEFSRVMLKLGKVARWTVGSWRSLVI